MARQKEIYKQEAEVRRERRERKRLHEEQKEEAKKRRLEEEEECKIKSMILNQILFNLLFNFLVKLMRLRAAALNTELSGVVTLSDNTDESAGEEKESDESDRKRRNDDDDTDRSGHSEDSDDDSSVSRRHDDSDKESERSRHFNERSPTPERSKFERSRSVTPRHLRSRSKSPLSHERSKSRTHSRSHTRSRSPDEELETTNNGQNTTEPNNEEKEEEIEELPPYIPAIQGCRSVEEFQCLNRIEEGTYGVVYRARDKRTEEIVALKRLKMEKEKEGFPITSLREINTLLKGQHSNIVTVREIVVGSNMDKIFIVMDYVEHDLKSLMETMRNKKQGFVPGEVKCLLQQLLRAVAHLHDNWILHRDLKTSNLLLSHKGILKVGDFGLAREYGSPLKAYTPIVVTLWYRAPELLLCAKEYSTPIDMWSVGCIFAELLLMNALFPGKSEVDQLNRIFKDLGTPNEKIWPGYSKLPAVQKVAFSEYPMSQLRIKFSMLSEIGLNLLGKFLTYDPAQRITAEAGLKHGYFTETPLPIDPAMFPTWPAKSELGHRKALAASPKPPSGGGQYKKLVSLFKNSINR